MNPAYEEIIKKCKPTTIDYVRASQQHKVPFMNNCRMLNCDRYRYSGRTYGYKYSADYPEDTFGIISVENMPYQKDAITRSDQSFISRLDSMIMNNKISPLLLFINDRFVKWENIDVVYDCGNTWLKVYGEKYNYFDIKKFNMIIIPFQVSYIATEAEYLFNKYYNYACKFINESAKVRSVHGVKRLVVNIPRLSDTYITSDNESIEVGMWYYNQLKLYFSGLLDNSRIEKLKKITVNKTNYNDDGTIDRMYNTSVNLLDDDSIIQAQLDSVMNINADTIRENAIFRFDDDGLLDYEGETIIANLEDCDYCKKQDVIFRKEEFQLKPDEYSPIVYSNDNIGNILFRENYILFRNGLLCNARDSIQIGPYNDEGINQVAIPTNGYRVYNKFMTFDYFNGDNISNNTEWTQTGYIVEPDPNKKYDLTVLTFYNQNIDRINNLAYKIPNMTYIEGENGKDLDEYYLLDKSDRESKYLYYLLKNLSFKYGNNTLVEDEKKNAFNKILNHDISLFNSLYKKYNNYESCVLNGEYVNINLVTEGFFRQDGWEYTLNIPRMQNYSHQVYAMVFIDGVLIDNLHLSRYLPNKICIPMHELFDSESTIEIFYFNNCNNNELQFTIEQDSEGNIDRSINLNNFEEDKLNIFTGEYQLNEDLLVYPDIVYDECTVSFALDYSLEKSNEEVEIDYDKIYSTGTFDGTRDYDYYTSSTLESDYSHTYFTKQGEFKILEDSLKIIDDVKRVRIKYINSGYEEDIDLELVLNTTLSKQKYEITLDVPNEEFFYNKPLIMAAENKFIYQRLNFTDRRYKIIMDKRFRYCDNQLQYMVFVNGRKLNHYDYLISIPKLSRPFNVMYLYLTKFVGPGDRLEIFYTPIKCNDFAFNDDRMLISQDGYVSIYDKNLIKYPFTADSYFVFINGKKVCRDDIIELSSSLFKVSKDYKSYKNLSIIPLLEDNKYPELDEYLHGDTMCDWDKAIDILYGNSIEFGPKRLDVLYNNAIQQSNVETDYLSINVGRIAIINEIIRDFWISNGYNYNKDAFLYDYYTNDDYKAIYKDDEYNYSDDESKDLYILPAMNATDKGIDENGNEAYLNIAKNDLYHLYFTYTATSSLDGAVEENGFREIGEVLSDLTFHWEYNNFYDQLDLSYQKLFNDTNSRFFLSGGTTVDNDERSYTLEGEDNIIYSDKEDERYYKFRIKSSDGYSVYNSYCELSFVSGLYYGLVDEDLLDTRKSDIYNQGESSSAVSQKLVGSLTKKLNDKAELVLEDYRMDNFKYFVLAVPKRYIYKDGKEIISFYLPDIKSEEITLQEKNKGGFLDNTEYEDIRLINAPTLTNGRYEGDDVGTDDDHYRGNLVSLDEYKLEKFKEFTFVNRFGYSEEYVIFKSNGFFTKLKDNTTVRISMRVNED